MDRLRVFISSRIVGNSEWRETAARACTDAGHEPVRMPEGESKNRRKRDYMRELARCDLVVYLVDDPSPAVDEEVQAALRDGKPVIMLTTPRRMPNGDRLLSDFAKKLRMDGPLMVYTFDGVENLRSLVQSSVETVIASRFSEPRRPIIWGGDTYQRLIETVREVNARFAFAQETSSLILGPHKAWFSDEEGFLDEFYNLVDKLCLLPELEIIHVFDVDATSRAWHESPEQYPARTEWLARLATVMRSEPTSRLRVRGVSPRLNPFMIADDMVMLGHHIGPDSRRASFHREVGEWSMAMWRDTDAALRTGGIGLDSFLADHIGT